MRNGKPVVFLLEDEIGVGNEVRRDLDDFSIELLWAKTLHDGQELFDANKAIIDLVALDSNIWEPGFDRPRDGRSLALHIFDVCSWRGLCVATSTRAELRATMLEMIPVEFQRECHEKYYLALVLIQLLREAGKLPA